MQHTVARHWASLREPAEFPTSIKEVGSSSFLVKRERSFARRSWDLLEIDSLGALHASAIPLSCSRRLAPPLDSFFITKNDDDPGSRGQVWEMGIGVGTLNEARRHVAAVERYPELGAADLSRAEVLRQAAQWDAIQPQRKRTFARKAWAKARQPPASAAPARYHHLLGFQLSESRFFVITRRETLVSPARARPA